MEKEIMYKRIYQDLLKQIQDGALAAGEQLPTEKTLSELYGVSRITAKKSMDLLAEQSYIIRTQGRGSFVNSIQEEGKWKSIGVIFDNFDSDFGSRMLRSIERECDRLHYNMILKCTYGSVEAESQAIKRVMKQNISGIILMCAQGENYNPTVLGLALKEYPIVLVDRAMHGITIPCVKTDNYLAAEELTRQLIGKGHHRICFLTHSFTATLSIHDRYEGFVNCMMQYEQSNGSLALLKSYDPSPENVDEAREQLDDAELEQIVVQNQDCTAFIAAEYRLALVLSSCLKSHGMDRIIGTFDGIEQIYEQDDFIHVRQNEQEIGRMAVRTLDKRIHGDRGCEEINVPYEIR